MDSRRAIWTAAAMGACWANGGCTAFPAMDQNGDGSLSENLPSPGEGGDEASTDATLGDVEPAEASDAQASDGPEPEAGCPSGQALCNGHCTILDDLHSCGSCDNDCTALPHVGDAGFGCHAGRCSYACSPGYGDCDDAGAGCLTSLSASPACGTCGAVCSGSTPNCSPGDAGAFGCTASCSTKTGTPCGSCGGTTRCDGSCTVGTPGAYGMACGHCGGKVKCDGTCSVPDPAGYGTGCGSCGGTVTCAGTCSVSTPSNYGQTCGNCGKFACDGSCGGQGACAPNATKSCDVAGLETCTASCTWGPCTQPSCQGGGAGAGLNCGSNGATDCCASYEIPSGTFYGGYYDNGVDAGSANGPAATISGFRLDAFDVTVGRFRKFVAAWDKGSVTLANGAGKHTYLNGGAGLANCQSPTQYESGWSGDVTGIAGTLPAWTSNLQSGLTNPTWTQTAGANESLPITGLDYKEAYAFCIWDGGFLPTAAEYEYAAVGGSQERVYPWSSPPGSLTLSCAYATYSGCATFPSAVGALSAGVGRWGQFDLVGNVFQWELDYGGYSASGDCFGPISCGGEGCSDPAVLGGAYTSDPSVLVAASYSDYAAVYTQGSRSDTSGYANLGVRCARVP